MYILDEKDLYFFMIHVNEILTEDEGVFVLPGIWYYPSNWTPHRKIYPNERRSMFAFSWANSEGTAVSVILYSDEYRASTSQQSVARRCTNLVSISYPLHLRKTTLKRNGWTDQPA
jgi:hypothetical protein